VDRPLATTNRGHGLGSGFAIYDRPIDGDFKALHEHRSFRDFARGLDQFAKDLDNCVSKKP
jgi:hypothetical protein